MEIIKKNEILKYFEIMKSLSQQDQLPAETLKSACVSQGFDKEFIERFINLSSKIHILINKNIPNKVKMKDLNLTYEQLLREKRKYFTALKLHRKKMSRILYKYKPLNEFTIPMLEKNELWLSSIKELNDVHEGINPVAQKISREYLKNYLQHLSRTYGSLKNHPLSDFGYSDLEDYYKRTLSNKINNTKIGSFTTSNINAKMWAHYADSNKGICLEFDIFEDLDFFDPILKVDYTPKFPKITYLENPTKFPIKEVFLTKSKDWQEEEEIRVIKSDITKNNVRFNKTALKSITFGLNSDPKKISDVKKTLVQNSYDIKLYRLVKQEQSFEFSVESI